MAILRPSSDLITGGWTSSPSIITSKQPWRRQPQVPVDVDWSRYSPVFAAVFSSSHGLHKAKDIVTGTTPTTGSAVISPSITEAGIGPNYPNGVSSLYSSYSLKAKQKFSGDFTILLVGKLPTGSSNVAIASICSGGVSQLRMQPNYNGSTPDANNSFSLLTYDGAFTNAGSTNVITGKTQVFIGRRKGTEHTLWVDGANKNTTIGTVRDVSQATSVVIGNFNSFDPYGAGGPILAYVMLDYALSDSVCAYLSEDAATSFWQIFRPLKKVSYFLPPLYQTLDETTASDTDYIETTGTGHSSIILLGSGTDPGNDNNHKLNYRASSTSETLNVDVVQLDGSYAVSGVVATRTPTLTSSPADYSIDLTSGEAATITDYTKLGLRFRT